MRTRALGEQSILTPELDSADLEPVDTAPDDDMHGAYVRDAGWEGWELVGARISGTEFVGLDARRALWRNVALVGCVLDRVDLSSAVVTSTTFERCLIVGCRLTGMRMRDVTLKNVLFDDCRLDYSILDTVRASAPVGFAACSLANTCLISCRLPQTTFSDCRLTGMELNTCDLSGSDLRGSPFMDVSGLASLRGATIDPSQLNDLASVAARDLRLMIKDPAE